MVVCLQHLATRRGVFSELVCSNAALSSSVLQIRFFYYSKVVARFPVLFYFNLLFWSGNLELEYVPSAEQRGDIFTKCLYTPQHETLRSELKAMNTADFRTKYSADKQH